MFHTKWVTTIESPVYEDALSIRYEVFVTEQKFPHEAEIDEIEADCEYIVIYDDKTPVATARIFPEDSKTYRMERVAVLIPYRKKRLGAKLVKEIENRGIKKQKEKIVLNAQDEVIPFYETCGYKVIGDLFYDYDVPHHKMEKVL